MAVDENVKTYLHWKEECARKRKTPMDMVEFSRSLGMDEAYTATLCRIINEMEAHLSEPAP